MIGALPADLDAAVCVVMHIPATGGSVLPKILDRRGRLPAVHATDGARIENGRIYAAPPDRHLLLERGRVRLGVGAPPQRTPAHG